MKTKFLAFAIAVLIPCGVLGVLFLMMIYPVLNYVFIVGCFVWCVYNLYKIIYKKLTNKNK